MVFSAYRRTLECQDTGRWSASEAQEEGCTFLNLGGPGTGKTLTFMTALSSLRAELTPIPGIGGSERHVTRHVNRYSISDWLPDSKIKWVDTPGITDKNFTLEMLDDMVEGGKVPDGYDMYGFAGKAAFRSKIEAAMPPPTAINFFIEAAQTNDPALMNDMKKYIERITILGHSPLVIVTKTTGYDAADILQRISGHLKIPTTRIFPIIGYVNQTQTEPAVDQNIMKLLEMNARISEAYVKANRRKFARILAEKKAAEDKAAEDKAAAEKKAAEDKAAEEKAAAGQGRRGQG